MRETERDVELTRQFRRDWKLQLRSPHGRAISPLFLTALALLRADAVMPDHYRDRQLGGQWKDCRDCHIKPDLVLIYSKPDDDTIQLIRLGSHSELSL